MGEVERRLREKGIELPPAPGPAANYAPFVQIGRWVHVAGQIPVWDGEVRHRGEVGTEVGLKKAREAARLVGLNLLAQARVAAGGDLDRIRRCVKLNGYVRSASSFDAHPRIIDAASELMVEVLGEAGIHARAAVGVSSLPFGVPVEIDGLFDLGD